MKNIFYEMQKSFKIRYVNAKIANESIHIELKIDRGGRIIDCTRVGRLYDRIQGRQLLSLYQGVNQEILAEIEDEVNLINGIHFIPTN